MLSSSSSWSPLWRNQFVRIRPSPVSQHRFGSPVRTQPLALFELPSRREAVISPTTSGRWGGAPLRVGYTARRMGDGPPLPSEHGAPSESPSKPCKYFHLTSPIKQHIFCYTTWLLQVVYCVMGA